MAIVEGEEDLEKLVMVEQMGGDGDCSNGGDGTREDISTYLFDNFKVSPGLGGLHYTGAGGDIWRGGGGGGIMINDEGPEVRINEAGIKLSVGQGYGGGGTFHVRNGDDRNGEPGVIIIEIVGV